MRQLIAAATVLAGITFAGTARANEITNIASAAEEITLTSGQITVGNPGTVHLHFGISIRNQGDTVNPHDYLPD